MRHLVIRGNGCARTPGIAARLLFLPALSLQGTWVSAAPPTLDATFGDHAVIQKERPIGVEGRATPGTSVAVSIGDARAWTTAGADGRFRAEFPPMPAGGPFRIQASSSEGTSSSEDVFVGDVFLCSGQSNMEFEFRRSQGSISPQRLQKIRLLQIPKTVALQPTGSLPTGSAWKSADGDGGKDFSAVCLFMVDKLAGGSPAVVGAIESSWGGTTISTWMSDGALRQGGLAADAELLQLYRVRPSAAIAEAGRQWEAWWRATTRDVPGKEPWSTASSLKWKPVPAIGFWEDWDHDPLADFNGKVWFRKSFRLSPAQAKRSAKLSLGRLSDIDWTWVNGQPIGTTGNPGTPRAYEVPAHLLHAGTNQITVILNNVWQKGGFRGPSSALHLDLQGLSPVQLGSGWEYSVEDRPVGRPPRAPWDDVAGDSTIYNAMISPLGGFGFRGIAWYQGESDAGIPAYDRRLRAMIDDWRTQFRNPALPFVVIQLANFGPPHLLPTEDDWASVREAQRRVAAADPHSALVTTIDLGDPFDVHPTQKMQVGLRAARAMSGLLTMAHEHASGPQARTAVLSGNGDVTVYLEGAAGRLVTRSSSRPIGFELCDDAPASCRFADAELSGDKVLLHADGRRVARVRYAWSAAPVVNLTDADGTPVGPFELPVTGIGK